MDKGELLMPILVLIFYIGVVLLLVNWNVYIALGFIVISSFLMKMYFPQIKGYIGEQRVNKLLLKLGEGYTVFHDLYVEKEEGRTTQIDHVVVSKYGIFVIETKNYTGWIFGNEQQKNWTQTIYKNRQSFYNPILQNRTHIKALQRYLNLESGIQSIIVFSDSATFKFKDSFKSAQVIKTSQLKKTISQYKNITFSEPELNVIMTRLNELSNANKGNKAEIKKQHLEQFNKPKKQQSKIVNQGLQTKTVEFQAGTCPKCGQQLIEKRGKYGKFYGCAGYPKCRYTRDIS